MTRPQQIQIIAHQQAALVSVDPLPAPGPGMALARTLVSLISPGTEINANYLAQSGFPKRTGYAMVVEIAELGPDNPGVSIGDLYLSSESHRSHLIINPAKSIKVPSGLKPETALFARLMAVSMTSMVTTKARPPGRVLVTGLGPVGNLAAQLFNSIGYRVDGYDPVPDRSNALKNTSVTIIEKIEEGEIYDLALECSGHEAGVLSAAKAVRQGGEVVLIGVPWKKNCDLSAHELLSVIFHRYINIRSGWEWELSWDRTRFRAGSLGENYFAAFRWLQEGRVNVDDLYDVASPQDCQSVYTSLHARTRKTMVTVFDWRGTV